MDGLEVKMEENSQNVKQKDQKESIEGIPHGLTGELKECEEDTGKVSKT